MAYCGTGDVVGTDGILLNVGTDAIGTSTVSSYITKADSIINAKLQALGAPFDDGTDTPPVIKTISVDISGYYVMRSLYRDESQNKSEWTKELYDNAIDLLDQIAEGDVKLVDVDGNEIEFTGNADDTESNTMDYTPTFDEANTINQTVSPSKLDDIADDKDADT